MSIRTDFIHFIHCNMKTLSAVTAFCLLFLNCVDAENITAHSITRVGKLLIDTDAGVDDAFAILMALEGERLGDGPRVVGITCVNGNTYVDNVAVNVLKTLKVVNRLDVPVYKGAQQPLTWVDVKTDYFGKDGFEDFEYPDPPSSDLLNETHAVNAMISLVKANPGEVTLLALGPLTNIALAVRIYPSFLDDLQQLIILGGCVEGYGSVRPGVEFNSNVDPEANFIVFDSATKKPNIIVPCETSHRARLPMEFRTSLNATGNSKMWLLNSAEAKTLNPEGEYWHCSDALAAAVALTSGQIVTKSHSYYAEAIFDGIFTRGMILLDYTGKTKKPSNTIVVQDVCVECYRDLLRRYLTMSQE